MDTQLPNTRLPDLNNDPLLGVPNDDYANLVNDLAKDAIKSFQSRPASHRTLISISGVPGSGKTTLASDVVERINVLVQLQFGIAIVTVVSMDGFHYTREQLDMMQDPAEAHERRGAPFTFDAEGIQRLLLKLKEPVVAPGTKKVEVIYAPSFDHAEKDPVQNDISILPTHRIVILEGNYLSMTQAPANAPETSHWTDPSPLWKEIGQLFDLQWFVDTSIDLTRKRLAARHLQAGIVSTMEAAQARADGSDRRNSLDIVRWNGETHRVISGDNYVRMEHVKDIAPATI